MRVTKVKKFQLPFNSRLVNGDKQTTPISVNISKVDICLATLTETNQRDNACTNLMLSQMLTSLRLIFDCRLNAEMYKLHLRLNIKPHLLSRKTII